ncbi:asparagine synthase (glutamine-hydrolyzing) [soil metagenome]
MCGICGKINFGNKEVTNRELKAMADKIRHRGPDDDGYFIENNVGLGFLRLSIIDLSISGHQPKLSDDERYVLTFNGEIYNYIELRDELKNKYTFSTKTDSEVLLKAYIEWGEDCLHRFNGMFAFIIYDRKEKKIFGARDRFGVKPFYYNFTKESFIYSSEIPAILEILERKPQADDSAIFDYLVFNRTDQTEKTFFKEIKKLQHGCKFNLDMNGELKISKWYDLREKVLNTEPLRSPSEYKELFSSSVELRLRSDVPVGVCLSGGLDSSSIVSTLLHDFDKSDLQTFSAVYEKGETGDESKFIDLYRPLLKNMHFITPSADTLFNDKEIYTRAHGEPTPTTAPYAQFKVMELAKGKVVVTLDGQGADEQLAGYHYFFGFYFKDLLKKARLLRLMSETFNYVSSHRSAYGLKTFAYFLLPSSLKTSLRVKEKGYIHSDFFNSNSKGNSIAGDLYASNSLNDALHDHFEYKLEHLLKWEDRNSMWFSLESRVPFLDYRLVEKTLSVHPDLVINKGTTKHILREAMKGILPEQIRNRKDKIGFMTPEEKWFRTDKFKNYIIATIESDSFKNRGYFNTDEVKERYKKHLNGEINISKEIWKWINLEMWFKEFID